MIGKPKMMLLALGVLAIAALAVGCGSDDTTSASSAATASTTTGEPELVACDETGGGATISNLEVLSMSCADAQKVVGSFKSISKDFTAADGFECSLVSGGRLSGSWGCKSGDREFKFDFAD